MKLTRRRFLASTAAIGAGAAIGLADEKSGEEKKPARPAPTPSHLPRWRGFNLQAMYLGERSGTFREEDFAWIEEWGFDFVRLPLSYRSWSEPADWLQLRESRLKELDRAVELGQKHGVHVNLNLHRAPGYCVNPPKEPLDLWKDEKALEACAFHWKSLARRYRGLPNDRVSFDLLNEPAHVSEGDYVRVVKRLVEAIRSEDPARLVIADGLQWGRDPVHGLADLGVAQSTRGYDPMGVSHYRASWIEGSDKWKEPSWPLLAGDKDSWDRDRLRRERIEPWKALEKKGVGIHVGEWGAHQNTPHGVVLAWMRDCLSLWREAGWGWALWNFRGSFGILDSGRKDVKYESFRGRQLDREMLEVLRSG